MSCRGSTKNTAPKSRSVTSERIVTNSSNYRPPILCAGSPSGAAHLGSADHPARRTCWRVCAVMAASSRTEGERSVEPPPFMSAITCRARICQLPNVAILGSSGTAAGRRGEAATGLCAGAPARHGRTDVGMRAQVDRLVHSADGAARDLGLQDGRRRLVEVVIWLSGSLVIPPPSAWGKPGRPSPGGWADGDWVTSWGRMCGRGGQVQIAGPCPARRGPGSWTVRRGRYRLFASALEGAAGFAGRT